MTTAPTRIKPAAHLTPALTSLALAVFFSFAWYERYWKWRECFNSEGRCYDPVDGIMVAQAGPVWGSLALGFVLAVVFVARHQRSRRTVHRRH